MKVFTNNRFNGHWPVGTAAVIVASDKHEAARVLSNALFDAGLEQVITENHMVELNTADEGL